MKREYELVVGLETHAELSTKSKIFCGCTTQFGGEPNTHCCPICIGLPGALPKLNKMVVEYAVMAGLVTNCEISRLSKMDRKNYVYPDLPKAYQISQFDMPLCKDGHMTLSDGNNIRINRIHIEEDAGKLVHERGDTYIDYNRGGVPLIEIVTEPDFRSAAQAKEYVDNISLLLKYIGVSDCKMQEGSLRCDVNISVRPKGAEKYGTRAEIKNMNSISHMVKAIEYEYERQVEALENGEVIVQETRRWNEDEKLTESMRSKEDAHDYRYFPDPDLVSIEVDEATINRIKAQMPILPAQREKMYVTELDLPPDDATLISRYRKISDYFEEASAGLKKPRLVSNLILSAIFRRFATEEDKEKAQIAIPAQYLRELAVLVDDGKMNAGQAREALEKMLDSGKRVSKVVDITSLAALDDTELEDIVRNVIADNRKNADDYLAGNARALNPIIGGVMRAAKGKANPKSAEELIKKVLEQ